MTSNPASPTSQASLPPLWLLVEQGQNVHCFELPAHGDRCIVVGSASIADVSIETAAPIAFHLEREGAGVRLTPAYADACLRVDAQHLEGPRLIFSHAVVELAEQRLCLRLCDAPPAALLQQRHGTAGSPADSQSRHIGAGMDLGATTTEVVSPTAVPVLRQDATVAIVRDQLVTPVLGPAKTVALPAIQLGGDKPVSNHCPAAATQLIEAVRPALRPQPIVALAPPAASAPAPLPGSKFEAMPQPAVLSLGPPKPVSATTAVDVPVAVLPAVPALNPAKSQPPPARVERVEQAVVRRSAEPSSIEKLGTLTRQRPVAVIGGAIVGSLALGVFLVGAVQILGLHPSSSQPSVPASKSSPAVAANAAPESVKTSEQTSDSSSPWAGRVSPPGTSDVAPPRAALPIVAASDSDLPVAVGHLFAGRLPEAEQAYRELAMRHPDDPIYSTVTRILVRRNSPSCRPGNPSVQACPTVKP
jgi:hypothetical protein